MRILFQKCNMKLGYTNDSTGRLRCHQLPAKGARDEDNAETSAGCVAARR